MVCIKKVFLHVIFISLSFSSDILLIFRLVIFKVLLNLLIFQLLISLSLQFFFLLKKYKTEMHPKWFEVNDIPFKQMWPDDVYWFPLMLKNTKFIGYFLFKGHNDILKYTLNEIDRLDY